MSDENEPRVTLTDRTRVFSDWRHFRVRPVSNPEAAKIVDRLLACRDTLKVVERQYNVNLQPERAAMADAANALMAYDKTMTRIAEGGDA
jgi:hypothetical protein